VSNGVVLLGVHRGSRGLAAYGGEVKKGAGERPNLRAAG